MDILYKVFVDPFVQMGTAPDLLVQTLWEGLVAGVLYSLIALGFVLIFKASGVFNFAQGIMVVFAALTLVGFHEHGVPAFLALALDDRGDVRSRLCGRTSDSSDRWSISPISSCLWRRSDSTYFLIGFGELIFGGETKVMIADQLLLPRGAIDIKMAGRLRVASENRHRGGNHCIDHGRDARNILPANAYWSRPACGRR